MTDVTPSHSLNLEISSMAKVMRLKGTSSIFLLLKPKFYYCQIMIKYITIIALSAFLGYVCVACTLNFIMTHTEGAANDVVDTTTETNPKIDPQIDLTPI